MEMMTHSAQAIQQLQKEFIKSWLQKHVTDKHSKDFLAWSHLSL